MDKIEKLLKPASIEVVQPAGLSLSLSFGHMLDRFELIPDEKTPFLTFKGFFDPGQFPHIQIYPRNSKTETYVLLPNTLINSILLPEREVTSFSEEGILEKMLLEEKITKKENGKIEFQVTLTISSTEKHILVLDTEKSDSRHLTFALQKPVKNNTTNAQKQKKVESIIIDLAPPVISPREEMLLHPVTALMLYRRIDQLNITILNASPHSDSAQRLAALLDRQQKSTIEKQIGMKLKIVNISSVREQTILPKTKIYFHANLMREALILAQILPGEQVIEPMPESRISKLATDVEIYVGKNFE
ncbi:MAG: LytR C-terminal domain-containing protein [Deltaproteobacteria bacterium]|nr:LytR C-terminal domain-containing protein [Deltaproteobacteria bacterium]